MTEDYMTVADFCFILTPIDPQTETPFEILPGHFLQKADKSQTEKIEKFLEGFEPMLPTGFSRYKHEAIPDKNGGGTFTPLSPEEWRHWIIYSKRKNLGPLTLSPTPEEQHSLRQSLRLLEHEIESGLVFCQRPDGIMGPVWHGPTLHTYFHDHATHHPPPIQLTDKDLLLAGEYCTKLESLRKKDDTRHHHILTAFKRFDSLRAIDWYSDYRVIGLFSVIEALLTHNSRHALSHQIQTKVPLLLHRPYTRTIEQNDYFDDQAKEDTLWSKLYRYRSVLAHGGVADFEDDLKILKSHAAVTNYLHEIVRILLIHSLNETVLVTDLQAC